MTENRMELFIETLTGTAFELSCSPLETIVSIKAKIQYLEGIPVSQQHLIFKSEELNDDLCLQDYSITDGATLKLVLGMRGGPINTREVSSDNKKLRDLAEFVERRSETSGSGNRPFTVLVFHDGDKVHMYTLTERGECSLSPISGTLSDASSITSIKQVEELHHEANRENQVTREKMAKLQEQIRALNLTRSKRNVQAPHKDAKPNVETTLKKKEHYLPSLQTSHSTNHAKLPSRENAHLTTSKTKALINSQLARLVSSDNNSSISTNVPRKVVKESNNSAKILNISFTKAHSSFDESKINKINASKESNRSNSFIRSCTLQTATSDDTTSHFLPYIQPSDSSVCNLTAQSSQFLAMSLSNPHSTISLKKVQKHLPTTSSQASSSQRYLDLEQWIDKRPKTSPQGYFCRSLDKFIEKETFSNHRSKKKGKKTLKQSLSVSLPTSEKSSLVLQTISNTRDVGYDVDSSVSHRNKPNFPIKTGGASEAKASRSKPLSPKSEALHYMKSTKISPQTSEEARPVSARKLPILKVKKKTYKRCTFCNKRTGLATSYTCRCGKNFCASHRYAEAHHCSYDYKTEGRRILQMNNPVIAASKLPKI